MSDVVVIGAGICGLGTALLLARDGHHVTILEKDDSPAPCSSDGCWNGWDRKGVAQFRQPHNFMPGMRLLLDAELPDVQAGMIDAGAAPFDMLRPLPPWLRGQPAHPIDEQLRSHAIRRPTGEWVFREFAAKETRTQLRSGTAVAGLMTGAARHGIPHVTGVVTSNGERIAADLVVDASGRGSRGSAWLRQIGANVGEDTAAGGHFTYITRFFEGEEPEWIAPVLTELGCFSILTLPGERSTWSVTLFLSSNDPVARHLRSEDAYMRVLRACPLHAHWVDATPVSEVLVMGGVVDRYRRFASEGLPAATGFVAIADAWACTNPSAGRGMTVGMIHAQRLRDVLRDHADDPLRLTIAFDQVTERELRPWYDAQIASDRVRFDRMEASRTGRPPQDYSDPLTRDLQLLRTGMFGDGELFRLGLEYIATLATAQDILRRPGVRRRLESAVLELRESPPAPLPGPDRRQLEALAVA